jgi:hypothetical protein
MGIMKGKKAILTLCLLLAYIPFAGIGITAEKWISFFAAVIVGGMIIFSYEKKRQ